MYTRRAYACAPGPEIRIRKALRMRDSHHRTGMRNVNWPAATLATMAMVLASELKITVIATLAKVTHNPRTLAKYPACAL
jgi:hypothetical protein